MQVDGCQKFNVAIKRDLRHNDKFDELLNVQTLEKQTEQKVNTILSLSITVLILRSEEDFSSTSASLYYHSGNLTLGNLFDIKSSMILI